MKETRSKNKGQKTVREILEDIMKSEVRDEKLREKLSACGLEGKNQNMKTALVYSLYELARNGTRRRWTSFSDCLTRMRKKTVKRSSTSISLTDTRPCKDRKQGLRDRTKPYTVRVGNIRRRFAVGLFEYEIIK